MSDCAHCGLPILEGQKTETLLTYPPSKWHTDCANCCGNRCPHDKATIERLRSRMVAAEARALGVEVLERLQKALYALYDAPVANNTWKLESSYLVGAVSAALEKAREAECRCAGLADGTSSYCAVHRSGVAAAEAKR